VNPRRQLLSALCFGALTISLVGCSSESSSITSPVDTSPPQSPGNVHYRFDEPTHRDWLVWNPSASANVASYEVHYSNSPSGMGTVLGNVPTSNSAIALPLAPAGTVEYYRLRAIGTNGVASAFTAPIPVTRAAWDGSTPSPAGSGPGTADGE
jgi:hypothetical protein